MKQTTRTTAPKTCKKLAPTRQPMWKSNNGSYISALFSIHILILNYWLRDLCRGGSRIFQRGGGVTFVKGGGVTIHCLITKICGLGAWFLYCSYVIGSKGGRGAGLVTCSTPLDPSLLWKPTSIKHGMIWYATVCYCTVLHYNVLYCIELYCIVLYCNVM